MKAISVKATPPYAPFTQNWGLSSVLKKAQSVPLLDGSMGSTFLWRNVAW